MKLNSEDGGARRFILVSNSEATLDEPDKHLCRDVCAEQVRRVIGGYRNRDGAEVTGLGGDFATCGRGGSRRGGCWRSNTRRSGRRSSSCTSRRSRRGRKVARAFSPWTKTMTG